MTDAFRRVSNGDKPELKARVPVWGQTVNAILEEIKGQLQNSDKQIWNDSQLALPVLWFRALKTF